VTKHSWRQPASFRDKTPVPSDSRWIEFVNDDHLLWLMEWIPGGVLQLKYEREGGDKYVMDADELECYNHIKEQAETLMARPDAEHWTAEARTKRQRDALYGKSAPEDRP
jgi:hypothetical protein